MIRTTPMRKLHKLRIKGKISFNFYVLFIKVWLRYIDFILTNMHYTQHTYEIISVQKNVLLHVRCQQHFKDLMYTVQVIIEE